METRNPRRTARATIRDVSREAGVSIKTVSRVLNKKHYVAVETRERVEAVIAALRFQPSEAARALSGRRSHQVALVCDNPSPWYVYEMQFGVRLRCQRDQVRMVAQPHDEEGVALVGDVLSLVNQLNPDGVILTPPAADAIGVLEELIGLQVPFVRVQPGIRLDDGPSVAIDNVAAAITMTDHLLALGHRRIGFIQGAAAYAASEQRLDGFRQALARIGIVPDPALIRAGSFDFASGTQAANALLDLAVPPSAIFAANDAMAAGALAAAHRRGINVPEDLSIAGFDDADFAVIVWPALTTIRQPIRALGEAAADLLLHPAREQRHICLDHALIIRDSTAPPRD